MKAKGCRDKGRKGEGKGCEEGKSNSEMEEPGKIRRGKQQ